MKYFTRERYLAQQMSDAVAMAAADATWEDAVERYDAYLQAIRADMPESVRQLLDGFYLHDARILSMGQRGETFVISMQLDVPPNELLTITYTLAGLPEINKEPFLDGEGSSPLTWMYEEIERVQEADQKYFVHSILFGNGWEARLPFRQVHMATAFPTFPHPRSQRQVGGPVPTSQSA